MKSNLATLASVLVLWSALAGPTSTPPSAAESSSQQVISGCGTC